MNEIAPPAGAPRAEAPAPRPSSGRGNTRKGTSNRPSDPPREPQSVFLARLREYKEFIAILIFFLGGLAWVYGYFARKDQLDEIKCILHANMGVLKNQMQANTIMQAINKNQDMRLALQDRHPVTPDVARQILKLEQESQMLQKQMERRTQDADAAAAALSTYSCVKS